MEISMCLVARPSIQYFQPASKIYPKFSNSNQATKHYPIPNAVAPIRSDKLSSLVPCSQGKANRTVFEIMRCVSEKDDAEVEAQLKRLQNTCEMWKEFFGECILLLMAMNPIMQHFADAMDYDANEFVSDSSFGAFYGALIVSKECVKVLWKSQPIWGFIIVGFLIYKANICNIALHRNGRHPIWAGKPLTTLALGKFLADCVLLVTSSKRTPTNIVLASINIMFSFFMLFYFKAYENQERLKRNCQFESSESSS